MVRRWPEEVPVSEARQLQCPKCQATMEPVEFRGAKVDRCTGCAGIWFDAREHSELKAVRGSEAIDDGCTEQGQANNELRDIECPVCDLRLSHHVARKKEKIEYEQCTQCDGLYFDAGEFSAFKQEKGFVDILVGALLGRRAG